ncbi:MAG: hypothetical protein DSZ33_05440 [Gammaproteobacteria bacterium]|nr:MAG: hypothetical protein DSZ33_05440 [Gammaproteobacteria bacterium]
MQATLHFMQCLMTRWLVFLVLAGSFMPAQAELYRYVDDSGQVHYSDREPDDAEFESLEIKLPASAPADMSKKKPAAKSVLIYTSSTCAYCKQAKAWMKSNKVPFTERNITTSRSARRAFDKLGARAVPVILVGKQRINGFNPRRLQDLLDAP